MMNITQFIFFLGMLLLNTLMGHAQDETDLLLDELLGTEKTYTSATFKASRVIYGHSIEQPAKQEMEFRISHRFGRLDKGVYELFGLDQATIQFSLEYAPFDRLMVGIARTNYNKTVSGFLKYSILRQVHGKGGSPIHLSYFGSTEWVTLKNQIPEYEFKHRLAYVNQLLIARKFSKRLSLQVTPTYIHFNLVKSNDSSNDIFALGMGGRFKITQRLSINAEAFLVDTKYTEGETPYQIPLSLGIDLETGGHVFQIMISNAQAMNEIGFITQTTGDLSKGELHLGFNISRMFDLSKKSKH